MGHDDAMGLSVFLTWAFALADLGCLIMAWVTCLHVSLCDRRLVIMASVIFLGHMLDIALESMGHMPFMATMAMDVAVGSVAVWLWWRHKPAWLMVIIVALWFQVVGHLARRYGDILPYRAYVAYLDVLFVMQLAAIFGRANYYLGRRKRGLFRSREQSLI